MDCPFKVGDVVKQEAGGRRMKIAAVDKKDGRVRCTWTSGPAKHSQTFDSATLVLTSIEYPTAAPAPRR